MLLHFMSCILVLSGRAYGDLSVQSQPRLKATANIAVDNFAYTNLVSIKKLRIQGELPTSETTPPLQLS